MFHRYFFLFFLFTLAPTTSYSVIAPFNTQEYKELVFNPNTIDTVTGRVLKVNQSLTPWNRYYGISLILQTDHGQIEAFLAPTAYLERQYMKIVVGDDIEVTGSKIHFENFEIMMIAEVRKGGDIMRVRNKFDGMPMWPQGR